MGKETFDSVLNLKYFIQAVKLLWPPNFPSFSPGPLDALRTPEGSYGPSREPLV